MKLSAFVLRYTSSSIYFLTSLLERKPRALSVLFHEGVAISQFFQLFAHRKAVFIVKRTRLLKWNLKWTAVNEMRGSGLFA